MNSATVQKTGGNFENNSNLYVMTNNPNISNRKEFQPHKSTSALFSLDESLRSGPVGLNRLASEFFPTPVGLDRLASEFFPGPVGLASLCGSLCSGARPAVICSGFMLGCGEFVVVGLICGGPLVDQVV